MKLKHNRKNVSMGHSAELANTDVTPTQTEADGKVQDRNDAKAEQCMNAEGANPARRREKARNIMRKAGANDFPNKQGESEAPANLKDRKKEPYDPDLGWHPIPRITDLQLMEKIADPENILMAAKKLMTEPDKAVGVDGKTVLQVCTPLIEFPQSREWLGSRLLEGKYRPSTVRTVKIPKGNGKFRTLGIAIVLDRVVETAILQTVDASTPEGAWARTSYAYTTGLSVANAIEEAERICAEGHQWAICIDLKAFFDNVPHSRLKRKLPAFLADRRVVHLMISLITPIVWDGHNRVVNRKGSPQGSVISPLLTSKLYLHELDMELESRGLPFVRYADDCTVFFSSKEAAKRSMKSLIGFIENTMGCPVNKEKTKVVSTSALPMLGFCRVNGKWHMNREKEEKACALFLGRLGQFRRAGNEAILNEAVRGFRGFLNFYATVPDLAHKVHRLEAWGEKKVKDSLTVNMFRSPLPESEYPF